MKHMYTVTITNGNKVYSVMTFRYRDSVFELFSIGGWNDCTHVFEDIHDVIKVCIAKGHNATLQMDIV